MSTAPRPPQGVRPSPNIWHHPATYEIENRAFDPDGHVEAAMREIRDWTDAAVLDIGCGTGFHLPRWAAAAREVTGVEPHPHLAGVARRRTRAIPEISVREGTAQKLPVRDASIDMAHARWAYFFGPGSEPGLAELDRVMRRGGAAFVIDNDPTRSTFGGWFREGYPDVDPLAVERFWSLHGWHRTPIVTHWSFRSREDFEAVIAIEFDPSIARRIIAEHPGTEVDYAVNLWWRRF